MRRVIKGIVYTKIFFDNMQKHALSAYAAQAAYYIILSAFPFFMFLLTMVKHLPIDQWQMIAYVEANLPTPVATSITKIIKEVFTSSGTVASITILTTLWAASKAFCSLIYGLNTVYEHKENRNYFILRLEATLHTVIFSVLLLATLLLLAFGNRITHTLLQHFPSLEDAVFLVISIRTSASMCLLILFFLYMYIWIPNRKSSILEALPGAIATAVGWIGFSFLYSFYIDHISNFNNTYGSLTAIVLLMLWLYFCMYMLLVGGELNALIASIRKQKY